MQAGRAAAAAVSRRLTVRAHSHGGRNGSNAAGATMRDHSEMELMLKGYGLTTAKILYHYPDHPHLLQTYVWQDYDLAPRFPALLAFIDFWRARLDGPLHSVIYSHKRLISAGEWRRVDGELLLH